ncbi:HD domain-containing phosphohydrolase [Tritonibacter scottomollicae]|uniref:HD domain-containing phosphohydrolase n=1 Tax=Tritonibacter scottomollicae TaxID=483013 RepID=UPI003BABC47E
MLIGVVDDQRITLDLVSAILRKDGWDDVEVFSEPHKALSAIRLRQFDLLLIDYQMPGMDGLQLMSALRAVAEYAHVPMVMVTTTEERETRLSAIRAGATDFVNKPFDPEELKIRVRNLLALRKARVELEERAANLSCEVTKATETILRREEELICRLARAIEYRDGGTGEHISRVARNSKIIAEHLGADSDFCKTLYLAAPLHDVGKIGVPDSILNKPGNLSDQERTIIDHHTTFGAHILEGGESKLIQMACEIALTHHEKWDGSGYGQGLAGDDIPLAGRIVALADVVDALLTKRPYKEPWSFDDVCTFVHEQSEKHFDPDCVFAFEAAKSKIEAVYLERHSDVLERPHPACRKA